MDKIKLTFKKHKRITGLAGVGYPYQNVDMKINGKIFGTIHSPNWNSTDNKWRITVSIIKNNIMEDGNPNCNWMNILLKMKFEDENSAREWMKSHIDKIINKWNLHYGED